MDETKSETFRIIKMIRMRTGELIITELQMGKNAEDPVSFVTPAHIVVERGPTRTVMMRLVPWVPFELLSDTRTSIKECEISGFLNASPECVKLYMTWADIEIDNLKTFGSDFRERLRYIEKIEERNYKSFKEEQLKNKTSTKDNVSDSIIQFFETNENWGNSNTAH